MGVGRAPDEAGVLVVFGIKLDEFPVESSVRRALPSTTDAEAAAEGRPDMVSGEG